MRAALALASALTVTAAALAAPAVAEPSDSARVPRLSFRGEGALAPGLQFQGTTVGGLSSITYDRSRDRYYAISDARPELGQGDFRFYTLRVDLADGRLDPGDVTVEAVTPFRQADGTPFPAGSLDPEGLTLTRRHTLVMTSEGFARVAKVAPRVIEFGLDGVARRDVALPAYTTPSADGTAGVRDNLGIESAAVTPDGRSLFTGFENALVQDGPAATATTTSDARVMRFDTRTGRERHEYVYRTDPVAEPPATPATFSVNGLVELLPLNSRFLLAMERSFTVGAHNTIRIYRTSTPGATDVRGVADLDTATVRPMRKRLLVDLADLHTTLDNVEGLTLGPKLPGGGRAMLLVSDNNFTPGQQSQFLLFRATGVPRH